MRLRRREDRIRREVERQLRRARAVSPRASRSLWAALTVVVDELGRLPTELEEWSSEDLEAVQRAYGCASAALADRGSA